MPKHEALRRISGLRGLMVLEVYPTRTAVTKVCILRFQVGARIRQSIPTGSHKIAFVGLTQQEKAAIRNALVRECGVCCCLSNVFLGRK